MQSAKRPDTVLVPASACRKSRVHAKPLRPMWGLSSKGYNKFLHDGLDCNGGPFIRFSHFGNSNFG